MTAERVGHGGTGARESRKRDSGSGAPLACPFCGSRETEKQSDFGTSLMVRLHYCRSCRTSFEAVKWGDDAGLDLPRFLEREAGNEKRET